MKKLSLKKAIDISIRKWESIVANNGSSLNIFNDVPELFDFHSACGLCEWRDRRRRKEDESLCSSDSSCCPLYIISLYRTCDDIESPWQNWNRGNTPENAQKVLDKLKEIKNDYERRGYQIVKG